MSLKKWLGLGVIAATLTIISVDTASAQDDGGPGGPGEPTETPIDGGASLIAIGAAAYGAKKMLKKKNNKENNVA